MRSSDIMSFVVFGNDVVDLMSSDSEDAQPTATEPPVTISSSSDSDVEMGHEPEAPNLSDAAADWMSNHQAIGVATYWNDVVRMLDFDDHLDETETYKLMQSYRDEVRPQWAKPPRMNKSRWWQEMFILCIRDAESKAAFDHVFPATVADELIPIRSWALQDPEAFKAFIDSDPGARALVECMPVVDAAPRVFSQYSLDRLRYTGFDREDHRGAAGRVRCRQAEGHNQGGNRRGRRRRVVR